MTKKTLYLIETLNFSSNNFVLFYLYIIKHPPIIIRPFLTFIHPTRFLLPVFKELFFSIFRCLSIPKKINYMLTNSFQKFQQKLA